MKRNLLFAVLVVVIGLTLSTIPAFAQGGGGGGGGTGVPTQLPTVPGGSGGYQRFWLPQDLADYLGLNQAQIDQISEKLFVQSYRWERGVDQLSGIQDSIYATLSDPVKSPKEIGTQVGSLVEKQINLERDLTAAIIAGNKEVMAVLNKEQIGKIANLAGARGDVDRYLNLLGGAYNANLLVERQYSSITGGCLKGCGKSEEEKLQAALREDVAKMMVSQAATKAAIALEGMRAKSSGEKR